MKRSDAVKLLQSIILKHFNCDPDCCTNDDEMYSKILSEIESDIGMMAPPKNGIVNTEEQDDGSILIPIWGWDEE